jgi:hypothetical protein
VRKLIIIAASIAALGAPTAAMAAAPDGSIVTKDNGAKSDNASKVGTGSSFMTQNGQFISGHNPSADQWWADQTAAPGMRGDLIQALLGHDH